MPLVTARSAEKPAEVSHKQQQAPEPATQALPTIKPREAAPREAAPQDTVILPAFRGSTTKQSREHPPTNLHKQQPPVPRDEPSAAPAVPPSAPDALEKPRRRGPSRAMIGVGIAVVLILAAAWLLVSLPGTPGSADWAGDSDRNWPPEAPGGSPSAELTPSAPPASAPFEPPEPGQVVDNGLVPGVAPKPSSAAASVAPSVAGTPSNVPSSTPTGAASTPPLLDGGGGTGSGQLEAESFAWQWGVVSAALDGASGGRAVSGVGNGDWLRFDGVNVATVKTLQVRIANGSGASGRIEVRYDSPWASPVATVSVDNTGGWAQWRTRSVSCGSATGAHTVYVSFVSRSSGDFVYLDWISFS